MTDRELAGIGLWLGTGTALITLMSGMILLPITVPLAAVGLTCSALALRTDSRQAPPALILNCITLLFGLLTVALFALALAGAATQTR